MGSRRWLRPRLRWAVLGALTTGLLAAVASANLDAVTQTTVAHAAHVVQHLLTSERPLTPKAVSVRSSPARDQYAPLTPPSARIDITETPAKQTVAGGGT